MKMFPRRRPSKEPETVASKLDFNPNIVVARLYTQYLILIVTMVISLF